MTDLDDFTYSNDLNSDSTDTGSPTDPGSGGGILTTIDHVLGSIPGILDAWRQPVIVQTGPQGTRVTPVSQQTATQGTLLMVVLIAGLVWAVS